MKTTKHTLTGLRPVAIALSLFLSGLATAYADDAQTLKEANAYTDQKVSQEFNSRLKGQEDTLNRAKDYALQQSNDLRGQIGANAGAINNEREARQKADAQTLKAAQDYASDRALQSDVRAEKLVNAERDERIRSGADILGKANAHSDENDAKTLGMAKTYTDTATAGIEDSAVNRANRHSDANDAKTLATAQSHTDSRVNASNTRTDGLIEQEQKDRTRAIGTAKGEANRYTDGKVSASDQRTDGLIQSEQQARVKGDADTLSAANQHSDANDRKILTSANGYTDQQTQGIEQRANTFTREREIATNQRTDQLMDTEVQARVDGDKRTLRAANDYTDWRVDGIEQKANNYTNQRFGELRRQVERNRKRADAGIAGAMAMTAIPKVDGKDVSFGMAMSGYRDQGAVAAGFNIQTSPNTAVKLNTAWDSQSGAGVAAGIAMGW